MIFLAKIAYILNRHDLAIPSHPKSQKNGRLFGSL
jgi:hypothetical protein